MRSRSRLIEGSRAERLIHDKAKIGWRQEALNRLRKTCKAKRLRHGRSPESHWIRCYDFTPIMSHTLGACLLAVGSATSSTTHFRDVTGGVYKARERIHGVDLIRHY